MFMKSANLDAETGLSLCNRALSDLEELYRFVTGRLNKCSGELNEISAMCKSVTVLGRRLHQAALEQTQEGAEKAKSTATGQLSQFDVLTWIGTGTFGVTKASRGVGWGAWADHFVCLFCSCVGIGRRECTTA
jgi:hypothetical protein